MTIDQSHSKEDSAAIAGILNEGPMGYGPVRKGPLTEQQLSHNLGDN